MTRFSYTPEKKVKIETFKNISVIKNITIKDFNYQDDTSGVLFVGDVSSSKSFEKSEASILYPEVFNKLGHFKQFTIRVSSSS